MKKLVFDLDGTLVDPMPRDYLLYRDIMAELGHEVLPRDEYWALRRESSDLQLLLAMTAQGDLMFDFLRLRGVRSELTTYLIHDAVLPNVHRTLGELEQRYELHLMTSRRNEVTAVEQLQRLDLRRYFESVILTAGPKQPALVALGDIALVVGDTEHDVAPAQALNIPVVALTTGIRSRTFLERLRPTHTFDDIASILEVA